MRLPEFLRADPPALAVAIDAAHVSGIRVGWKGNLPAVLVHVSEPLPTGAVQPSLVASNITDADAVTRALAAVLSGLGVRGGPAALVVPDAVAKVSLVKFESLPAAAADLEQMVRWQVRKSAPFSIDEARVSFTPGAVTAAGRELITSVARADTIAEYEAVAGRAGLVPGLVDLSTFGVLNGVLASETDLAGDCLIVHATASYTTLAVLRGRDLIFFRNRDEEADGTLADVVHQTAMYYEDRLAGTGFARVLLAGSGVDGVDAVRHSLEQRLDARVETVPHPETAALLGVLLRQREAA